MNTDDVIEKIKKAIRLANKTTSEGERDTALRLAKNLADKNGIAFDEINAGESEAKAVRVDDEEAKLYNGSEIGHICFILREHFGVIVMFNKYRSSGKAKLTWFGCSLNIEIAKHVFHILRRESAKAWNESRKAIVSDKLERYNRVISGLISAKDIKIKRYAKTAFMKGFFFSIHQKLTEHPLRNDLAEEKKAAEKKFQDFRNQNNVKDTKARNSRDDAESLAKGFAMGNKVNLSRPCENHKAERMAIGM